MLPRLIVCHLLTLVPIEAAAELRGRRYQATQNSNTTSHPGGSTHSKAVRRDSKMILQEQSLPVTLLDLLHNTLILRHFSPYLGLANLVHLAATSRSFQNLIYNTPSVFRHADLTQLAPHISYTGDPNSEASDLESTDQFYSRPVHRVFQSLRRCNVLRDVRTLVLDGLVVPLTLLTSILCDDGLSIRILSLRGVKELGDEKLIQILRYLIRPGRPEGTPKLKGLYYFTPIEAGAEYSVSHFRELSSFAEEATVGSKVPFCTQSGSPEMLECSIYILCRKVLTMDYAG